MPSYPVPDSSSDSGDNNNHPPRARRTNIRRHKLSSNSTFTIPTSSPGSSENEHSQDRKGTTTIRESRPERRRLNSFTSMSTILDSEEETSFLRMPIARLEDEDLDSAEHAHRAASYYDADGGDEAFVWAIKALVALVCLGVVGTVGYSGRRASWE